MSIFGSAADKTLPLIEPFGVGVELEHIESERNRPAPLRLLDYQVDCASSVAMPLVFGMSQM